MRAPCGTEAAYQSHKRRGEEPDPACKAARAAASHRRHLANKTNPKPRPVRPAVHADLPVFDDSAVCRQIGPDVFFVDMGESNRPAIAACQSCPFIQPCLEYALAWDVYGVWGGTGPNQRAKIRAERNIKARALSHWGRVINLDAQDGAA